MTFDLVKNSISSLNVTINATESSVNGKCIVSLFKKKSAPMVGVDISSTSVKLLELSHTSKGYRVESYAVEPLPPNSVVEKNITDVELVGEAVARAYKKSGSKAKIASCAVAGSAVITKIIKMSEELTEDELEDLIQVEADQYIPYPLDEVSLDFEVLHPSLNEPGQVDVLLAASRTDNVDARVAALELAGLNAHVVDVEAFALENAVRLCTENKPELRGDGVIAIIDVGATMTTLSVLDKLNIVYTREQVFGGKQLTEEIQKRYGLSYEEAGLAKRQGGLPDNYESEVLGPFRESMSQQINRALQFFYASSNHIDAVDHIILAGGCASTNGIGELLSAKTGADVTVANPFTEMTLASRIKSDILNNDAPAMMIACGLALRSFG